MGVNNLNAVLFCCYSVIATLYFADMMISIFYKKDYHDYAIRKHKSNLKKVVTLSVRERILALRLLEKQKEKPELAKQLGIGITMVKKEEQKSNK